MKLAPLPASQQGGGSTVTESEVREIADALFEDPSRTDVQADDQPQFSRGGGPKGEKESNGSKARSRTSSAADRMRLKVAERLEVDADEVHQAIRATATDAKGGVTSYGYWIVLSASGIDAILARRAAEEDAEPVVHEDQPEG